MQEVVGVSGGAPCLFSRRSRHVYKVDDIAFSHGGRISVYPVLAGQIGVARRIIAQNDFSESVVAGAVYEEVREVLRYYMLPKTK